MKSHFGITIPTKPYLSKYLQALYGSPIVFSTRTYFGTSLLGYLNTRLYIQNEALTFQKFNTFDTPLEIKLPSYWLTQYRFKTQLSQCNIIYLNKHFEEKFEEHLHLFCTTMMSVGKQKKDALEMFCEKHNIEVPEDITMDALVQKEYRQRKQVSKMHSKICA